MRATPVWLLILFFSLPIFAQNVNFNKGKAAKKNYYTEVAYAELKNKIIIPVKIQGQTYRFLFDTGAPNLISHSLKDLIQTKALQTIQVKDANDKRRPLSVVIIPLLDIGGVSFKNSPAIVNDTASNFLFDCLKIDGIIGSNLVRNAIVQIDSRKKQIILTDQAKRLGLEGLGSLDMALNSNQSSPYIWIRLTGEGKAREQVLLDTGAEGFYDLSFNSFKKLNQLQVFSHIDSAQGYKGVGLFGVSEPTTHYRVQLPSIDFLDTEFANVISVSTAALKSRIGADLLRYGKATLNFKQKRFYFEAFDSKVDLQEEVWSFSPTVKNGQVVVGIVWDESLSTSLKSGDSIIKINELDTGSMDICDLLVKASPLQDHDELNIIIKDDSEIAKEIKLENYYLVPNIRKAE